MKWTCTLISQGVNLHIQIFVKKKKKSAHGAKQAKLAKVMLES